MTSAATLPKIGAKAAGMTYAGVITAPDGLVYALCLLDDKPSKSLSWDEAMSWAKSVESDLPTRPEAALLFANLQPSLEKSWHWTNETAYWNSSYAWYCDFYGGYQDGYHKSAEGAAVAVRRFAIQSFDPLVFA